MELQSKNARDPLLGLTMVGRKHTRALCVARRLSTRTWYRYGVLAHCGTASV